MSNDVMKQIADNLGVSIINGSYLSGIANYYGVNLATSTDLMRDILVQLGGNPATSTDYLRDIVIELGGSVTINGNYMESWEVITAVAPAPVNTVAPVISGTTTLGSVLTTTNGTWSNSPTSYTYKWRRGAAIISGATSSTYTLVIADSNASITSEVTAINAGGSTPATSNAITAQTYTAPANTVAPVISGTTTLGSTLTSTTGTWTGNPSPTYAYQWKRGATNIGTNSSTYVLVLADSAAAITCVVTATNALGSSNATSNTITAANYIPVNTVAPVISGATTLGSVLTSTTGTWSNSPSSFAYQWKRGATNVGTNANTYTLVTADSLAVMTCVVTATNAAGSSAPATSNSITAGNYAVPFVPGDFNFADGNTDYTTNTVTFTKSGRLYIEGFADGEQESYGYLNGQQMFFWSSSASALTYPNQFNDLIGGYGELFYFGHYGVFDVSIGNTMYFSNGGAGSPFDSSVGTATFRITSFTGTLIDSFTATKVGGCYLTSATVQYKGLLDDGPELTAMRALRDYYKGDVYYDNLIAEYYESSGAIIQGIDNSVEPSVDYEFIYQSVLKVKDYVDQSMWVEGWNEYYNAYLTLKNKYITNV
jgi:hypothetical protein